tara:strand:- start:2 stop:826 length:825 start_codon:yes stop_codon:yes gene_type:complete
MDRLPIFFCSFLVLLSLFGGSAGETVSISVNPGWMEWEARDCEMVTDENGTWEDCEYYEVYQTNITDNGWKMDIALGENFTFAFIAANLENGTEYAFSYEIVQTAGNEGGMWQEGVANASHEFFANNTGEYVYNLTGQFIPDDIYLNNCTSLRATVSFIKNPNAENETREELAKFSTNRFSPSGSSIDPLCQTTPYQISNNSGGFLGIFGLCLSPILFLFTVSKMFSLFFQPSDTEVADNTRIDVVNSNTRALFWLIMMFVSVIMFFMSMIVMW